MCDSEEVRKLKGQLAERDALLRELLEYAELGWDFTPDISVKVRAALSASAEPSAPAPMPAYMEAACDKFDWTPEEALRFYAEGKHFDTDNGRTRILCTGAIASHALKGMNKEYADLKGSEQAEPSAPVERDELTDEQIIGAMRSYLNNADGGYVVDTAPGDVVKAGRALLAYAGRSAQVERDERASFEANVPIPAYVYWDEKQSRYLTNCNHSTCAVYQGSFEGWMSRAALERKPPVTPRDAFAAWEPTGNPIRGVNGRLAAKAGFDAGWCAGWTECRADMERKPS